jgi:hypothetical protein
MGKFKPAKYQIIYTNGATRSLQLHCKFAPPPKSPLGPAVVRSSSIVMLTTAGCTLATSAETSPHGPAG